MGHVILQRYAAIKFERSRAEHGSKELGIGLAHIASYMDWAAATRLGGLGVPPPVRGIGFRVLWNAYPCYIGELFS